MAEGVLFNIAERIIVRLGTHAFQQIGSIWGVQDELNKLKEKVAGFQDVLLDAEQKQANNNEVKLWLQSVEDAVYEADDVLDEFNTQVQRRQVMRDNTELSKVRLFFSSSNQLVFGLEMSHKIKDINKRLSEVASRRPSDLNNNREDTRFILRESVTHSFVPNENIIGRDEDKLAIIQLLLDPISTENVSTISIVGIGGLGKSALAQVIFNDEVIPKHFELKIWICVSNIFELDILAKKILKADELDKKQRDKVDQLDMDQLQIDLRKKVDGKKYLLVLDDVWNEDPHKWFSLMDLLKGGGEGSRILITTRTKTVAMTSHTTKQYPLRGLNEVQSWSLFKKMTFQDGKEPENSTIKAVGMEVVRKCQGVPLAIRTIGGMLCKKHHEIEWFNFKERKLSKISQTGDDILPTLKLSYDVLPTHLKHCFAYCSLFPPDYDISVPRLIRLWVAQGFIESFDENECLEDVAFEYYRELLCRSFFQEEKTNEFGVIESCKMHDLMNELAISVSEVRSTVVEPNQKNFDEKLHHVSFDFDIDLSKWEVPTSLLKASKIRTFLFLRQQSRYVLRQQSWYDTFLFLRQQSWYEPQSSSSNAFYTTIVSNFKSLRTLSLNKLDITTSPNCLGKMKHLRYLDLSENSMKRLPDWIVGLWNLETLDLTDCWKLVELPRDIKKMINLRHLILEGCYGLSGMPRGIGELNGVRTLNRFVLSESNCLGRGGSAGLAELGTLKELRGDLEIDKLRHVVSESNVGTPLKDKQHLCSLDLRWKQGEDISAVDEEDIIKSMEVLQPHSNLKQLTVRYYGGVRLPDWIVGLSNLETLDLSDCRELVELPRDIKKMINLRHLILEGCDELSGMPRGIGELNGVRTLNKFVLSESNCLGRGGSAGLAELGTLNELRGRLVIYHLRHVVSESNVGTPLKDKQHLHSLTLRWKYGEDVRGVDEEDIIKSMEVLQPHSNLKQLSVFYYGGVRFTSWFSSLINIVNLALYWCERCQHLPPLDHLPSLKSLTMVGFDKLEYISEKESLSFFPSLEKLYISQCPVLKGWWRAHTHNNAAASSSTENLSLPSFPRLSTLIIKDCPNLTSLPL